MQRQSNHRNRSALLVCKTKSQVVVASTATATFTSIIHTVGFLTLFWRCCRIEHFFLKISQMRDGCGRYLQRNVSLPALITT